MLNRGISFGIELPAVEIISGGMLLVVIWWSVVKREWRGGLIVLGGLLNLVERLRFGYVTDYWKIPMIPLYNNVNDWLIFVGVVLLIWKYCLKMR